MRCDPGQCIHELAERNDPSRDRQVTHAPGDNHQYDLTCKVCGQRGVVRILVDPEREPTVPDGTLEDALQRCSDKVSALLIAAQRFYDFVADCDQAIIDAWHFTERAQGHAPDRTNPDAR